MTPKEQAAAFRNATSTQDFTRLVRHWLGQNSALEPFLVFEEVQRALQILHDFMQADSQVASARRTEPLTVHSLRTANITAHALAQCPKLTPRDVIPFVVCALVHDVPEDADSVVAAVQSAKRTVRQMRLPPQEADAFINAQAWRAQQPVRAELRARLEALHTKRWQADVLAAADSLTRPPCFSAAMEARRGNECWLGENMNLYALFVRCADLLDNITRQADDIDAGRTELTPDRMAKFRRYANVNLDYVLRDTARLLRLPKLRTVSAPPVEFLQPAVEYLVRQTHGATGRLLALLPPDPPGSGSGANTNARTASANAA